MPSITPSEKLCCACGAIKPASEYYRRSDNKNRLKGPCKSCTNVRAAVYKSKASNEVKSQRNAKAKKRRQEDPEPNRAAHLRWHYANIERAHKNHQQWYEENKERKSEYSKAYREANKACLNQHNKEYYRANKAALCAQKHEYYQANRESILEQKRQYNAANPDRLREANNLRRAREKQAGGSHTAADIEAHYATQQGKCYWCGISLEGNYHVDHIIPISKGGSNDPGNICCSCPFCNLSKHDKMPYEFSDRLF